MARKRTPLLVGLLVLSFISLLLRLFWLQIIKGKENKLLADTNRIKIISLPALRGVIFDRQAEVLVRNAPSGREYVLKEATAHVLGYLGEATDEELANLNSQKPPLAYGNFPEQNLRTLVGKLGIEKEYDQTLRGVDGGILVETDTTGKKVREVGRQTPTVGQNLVLTLDKDFQQKAFEVLKGRKGAIVASDPKTGEILALVSSPSFDPNVFTQQPVTSNQLPEEETGNWKTLGLSSGRRLETGNTDKIQKFFSDPDQPMFDRAIAGLYPPGSTFKIVTATAGLQEGKIDENTQVEDTGEIRIGRFVFGNWYFRQYGRKEGVIGLVKAIKRSNDIFFYKVGEWLGATKLADWAHYFGLGKALGIDLPGEAEGLVPTPEWKEKEKKEPWYLGDTFITAIGQGNLLLTPLQVNNMMAVIASKGKLCRPHLLKEPLSDKSFCQDLELEEKNLKLIQEGLKEVCETGGTAWPFFEFGIGGESSASASFKRIYVGCKTGTAEYGDPKDRTHAWLTVYAPWENPEIVVTVLLEGAGEGSDKAGPVAKEILKYWFSKNEQ